MFDSNTFSFLGLQVHWYGVLIAASIALGVALQFLHRKKAHTT